MSQMTLFLRLKIEMFVRFEEGVFFEMAWKNTGPAMIVGHFLKVAGPHTALAISWPAAENSFSARLIGSFAQKNLLIHRKDWKSEFKVYTFSLPEFIALEDHRKIECQDFGTG